MAKFFQTGNIGVAIVPIFPDWEYWNSVGNIATALEILQPFFCSRRLQYFKTPCTFCGYRLATLPCVSRVRLELPGHFRPKKFSEQFQPYCISYVKWIAAKPLKVTLVILDLGNLVFESTCHLWIFPLWCCVVGNFQQRLMMLKDECFLWIMIFGHRE